MTKPRQKKTQWSPCYQAARFKRRLHPSFTVFFLITVIMTNSSRTETFYILLLSEPNTRDDYKCIFLTHACQVLFFLFFSVFQVAVSTQCPCPTPTARAPVKPVSPSHWSCPLKTPSPTEPTLPPPWRKALPPQGKAAPSLSSSSADSVHVFPAPHAPTTLGLCCLLRRRWGFFCFVDSH